MLKNYNLMLCSFAVLVVVWYHKGEVAASHCADRLINSRATQAFNGYFFFIARYVTTTSAANSIRGAEIAYPYWPTREAISFL
jgi:hypothetical protein